MPAPHATSPAGGLQPSSGAILRHLTRLRTLLPLLLFLSGCGEERITLPPDKAVARGWKDYDAALYDEAELLFADAARRTSPADDLHWRALYGQASTVNLRRPGGDPERATSLYKEIIRQAPRSDSAAWSQLALARMVSLPLDGKAAPLASVVSAYQPVIDQHPFHKAGEEAFAFQQAARVASFEPREQRRAAELMEAFVATHPGSVYLCHIYYLLGRVYENLDEPEKAVAAMVRYSELSRLDPKNPRSDFAGVYWVIATLANYKAGDFATARRFYNQLITEYPTEKRVYTAKLALKEMDAIEARLRAAPAPPR